MFLGLRLSSQPILPNHHHGGGIQFAVTHELPADGAAGGLVAGGEAVADVLIGEHGSRAVLHDIEFVELGQVQGVVLTILQGKGGQGVIRALHGLAVLIEHVLRKEFLDGGILPDDGEDFLDRMAAFH